MRAIWISAVVFAVVGFASAVDFTTGYNICPYNCNGHGFCPVNDVQTCVCYEQWDEEAPDCSRRRCPKGNAWFDAPDVTGAAHVLTECSNRGRCDYTYGVCNCNSGFWGTACQYLSCPNANGVICSGHGRCVTEGAAAAGTQDAVYTAWDAYQTTGCICDKGFTGYNCALQQCILGNDPYNHGTLEVQSITTSVTYQADTHFIKLDGASDVNQVQALTIKNFFHFVHLGGTFRMTFDSTSPTGCLLCGVREVATTDYIAWDATATEVHDALVQLTNIDAVQVSVGPTVDGSEGFIWLVTFTGLLVGGDVPLIQLDGSRIFGDSPILTSAIQTHGSYYGGFFTLTYDNTAADYNPSGGSVSAQTFQIANGASAATVQSTLNSLPNIFRGVTVTQHPTGGPGMSWYVTFLDYGSRPSPAASSADTSSLIPMNAPGAASVSCSITAQGSWLTGDWTVSYNGLPSPNLDAEASSATVAAAIESFATSIGVVTVNSGPYIPNPAQWSGEYFWAITFLSQPFQISTLVSGAFTLQAGSPSLQSSIQVTVGDQGTPVLGYETYANKAEVNEVQILECTCTGTCSGSFTLNLFGEVTAAILPSDTVASLTPKLTALAAINNINLVMYPVLVSPAAQTVCSATGTSTGITFTNNPGTVPGITVVSNSLAGTSVSLGVRKGAAFGNNGGQCKLGTRSLVECSNRGTCDFTTGKCTCYKGWGDSDGGGGEAAPGSGAGLGNSRAFRDCSYPNPALVIDCPHNLNTGAQCSGHGTCSGSPFYLCSCSAGYHGGACEYYTCPTGTAWWDVPTSSGSHAVATCSNEGLCDVTTGLCSCATGYLGLTKSCNQLYCPACANGASCLLMGQMAGYERTSLGDVPTSPVPYTGWDANMMQGCACDPLAYNGFYEKSRGQLLGFDCALRTCPLTADPHTTAVENFEVQTIMCTATSGKFMLTFRGIASEQLSYADTLTTLQTVLQSTYSIAYVTVTSAGTTICSGNLVSITFTGNHGDLPLLKLTSSTLSTPLTIAQSTQGTKGTLECSNRGYCNRLTGHCKCSTQYGSSDGEGNPGRLGDCGAMSTRFGIDLGVLPRSIGTKNSLLRGP